MPARQFGNVGCPITSEPAVADNANERDPVNAPETATPSGYSEAGS